MKTHTAILDGPCVNRRAGCIGRLVVERVRHRAPSGELSVRDALVCNRCGQAHGPALLEGAKP